MSRHFCIDRNVLGSSRHLLVRDTSITWVSNYPNDCWIYYPSTVETESRCLKTLFKLNGIDLTANVPTEHLNSFKTILKKDDVSEIVPWQHVLPQQTYHRFVSSMVKNIHQQLGAVSTDYFDVYSRVTRVFDTLKPARIDVKRFDTLYDSEENASIKSSIMSFRPDIHGYASKVIYNRHNSMTGRLTVKSGPEILTIKKEFRNLITSSYDRGKIYYVDYSALEARTFLSVVGKVIDNVDIYEDIRVKLGSNVRRDIVKLAVIMLLYGSGTEQIRQLLGMSYADTEKFVCQIKEEFCMTTFHNKLVSEWKDKNTFRNLYGRVIHADNQNLLLNYYVQSSAADICLLGYLNIINLILSENMLIKPLFLLHDAIVLDVHPAYVSVLGDLMEVGSKIEKLGNKFYMTASEIS